MRLSEHERGSIEAASRAVFPSGTRVLLFGSRTDDSRRGGDIDLLVALPKAMSPEDWQTYRARFMVDLYRRMEEQKIDVIMDAPDLASPSPVIGFAYRDGIELTHV
jgi:predicted nucleotidyltransferase